MIHQAHTFIQSTSVKLCQDTKIVKQEKQSMHAPEDTSCYVWLIVRFHHWASKWQYCTITTHVHTGYWQWARAKEFDSNENTKKSCITTLRFLFHHRLMQRASKLALGRVWMHRYTRRGDRYDDDDGKEEKERDRPAAWAGPSVGGRACIRSPSTHLAPRTEKTSLH